MVEVIVTMVIPAEARGLGYGGVDVEPAYTKLYRLEFDRVEDAEAYLIASKDGYDVRDDPRCLNYEQMVRETE